MTDLSNDYPVLALVKQTDDIVRVKAVGFELIQTEKAYDKLRFWECTATARLSVAASSSVRNIQEATYQETPAILHRWRVFLFLLTDRGEPAVSLRTDWFQSAVDQNITSADPDSLGPWFGV